MNMAIEVPVTIMKPFQLHQRCKKLMKVPSNWRGILSGLGQRFP